MAVIAAEVIPVLPEQGPSQVPVQDVDREFDAVVTAHSSDLDTSFEPSPVSESEAVLIEALEQDTPPIPSERRGVIGRLGRMASAASDAVNTAYLKTVVRAQNVLPENAGRNTRKGLLAVGVVSAVGGFATAYLAANGHAVSGIEHEVASLFGSGHVDHGTHSATTEQLTASGGTSGNGPVEISTLADVKPITENASSISHTGTALTAVGQHAPTHPQELVLDSVTTKVTQGSSAHIHEVYATGNAQYEGLHYVTEKNGGVTIQVDSHEGQTFINGHEVDVAKEPLEAKITANINGKDVSITVPMVDGKIVLPPGVAANAVNAHDVNVQIFAMHGDEKQIFYTDPSNGHVFHVNPHDLFKDVKPNNSNNGGGDGGTGNPGGQSGGNSGQGAPGTSHKGLDITFDRTVKGHNEYYVTNNGGTVVVEVPVHDSVTTGSNIPEFILNDSYYSHTNTPVDLSQQWFAGVGIGHNTLSPNPDLHNMNQQLSQNPYDLRIVHDGNKDSSLYEIDEDEGTGGVVPPPAGGSGTGETLKDVGIGAGIVAALITGAILWGKRQPKGPKPGPHHKAPSLGGSTPLPTGSAAGDRSALTPPGGTPMASPTVRRFGGGSSTTGRSGAAASPRHRRPLPDPAASVVAPDPPDYVNPWTTSPGDADSGYGPGAPLSPDPVDSWPSYAAYETDTGGHSAYVDPGDDSSRYDATPGPVLGGAAGDESPSVPAEPTSFPDLRPGATPDASTTGNEDDDGLDVPDFLK